MQAHTTPPARSNPAVLPQANDLALLSLSFPIYKEGEITLLGKLLELIEIIYAFYRVST